MLIFMATVVETQNTFTLFNARDQKQDLTVESHKLQVAVTEVKVQCLKKYMYNIRNALKEKKLRSQKDNTREFQQCS